MRLIILLLLSIFSPILYAQQEIKVNSDYLKMNFDQLESEFWKNYPDSVAIVIADLYLVKAKSKHDSLHISRGFDFKARLYEPELNILYADSIIRYSENLNHQNYPAVGYSLKAFWNYQIGDYKKALDNYLIAYDLAKKNNNLIQIIENGEGIISIKDRWGGHEEALDLYKEQLDLIQNQKNYRKEYKFNYLNTLYNLNVSYKRNRVYDSASYYINKGIKESISLNDSTFYYDFVYSSGINSFFLGNYEASLDSLHKSAPHLDGTDLSMNYFYNGQIEEKKGNEEKARYFYLKMDSIYDSTQDVSPEIRQAYDFLIDYYNKNKQYEKQINYMDKLILADSLLSSNKYYLNLRTLQAYDIPKLKGEKKALTKKIKGKDDYILHIVIVSVVIILIISGLGAYQYKRKQAIYRRWRVLVQEEQKDASILQSDVKIENVDSLSNISKETINDILSKLEQFEKELGFLDKNLKLNILSEQFSTNSLYLSKVINAKKQKNFSNYLKDLRIDYAIELLKSNPSKRNYTIAAIADEVGFKSAESFSKTFFNNTSMYPSTFVQKLRDFKS